jgi:hypothetical protein
MSKERAVGIPGGSFIAFGSNISNFVEMPMEIATAPLT